MQLRLSCRITRAEDWLTPMTFKWPLLRNIPLTADGMMFSPTPGPRASPIGTVAGLRQCLIMVTGLLNLLVPITTDS